MKPWYDKKTCVVCGGEMPHHKQKYCSDTCQRKYAKMEEINKKNG